MKKVTEPRTLLPHRMSLSVQRPTAAFLIKSKQQEAEHLRRNKSPRNPANRAFLMKLTNRICKLQVHSGDMPFLGTWFSSWVFKLTCSAWHAYANRSEPWKFCTQRNVYSARGGRAGYAGKDLQRALLNAFYKRQERQLVCVSAPLLAAFTMGCNFLPSHKTEDFSWQRIESNTRSK